MIMRRFYFIAALVALVGCTTPITKGDSVQSKKQVSYPQVGVQSRAIRGDVAVLRSNYESRHLFRLTKPYTATVMLVNKIEVNADEPISESELSGETVYCTQNNTYIDVITGPWAKTCFKSSVPGRFNAVTYRPGAVWFNKEISPGIDFVVREMGASGQAGALKRELLFEGASGNTLLFSERIFEKSLDVASRIKPLVATVVSFPSTVTLDGMEITVHKFDENSVTFEVLNPWQ